MASEIPKDESKKMIPDPVARIAAMHDLKRIFVQNMKDSDLEELTDRIVRLEYPGGHVVEGYCIGYTRATFIHADKTIFKCGIMLGNGTSYDIVNGITIATKSVLEV